MEQCPHITYCVNELAGGEANLEVRVGTVVGGGADFATQGRAKEGAGRSRQPGGGEEFGRPCLEGADVSSQAG